MEQIFKEMDSITTDLFEKCDEVVEKLKETKKQIDENQTN